MVDLLNLDDVSDGHGHVDTDRNSALLDLVKTKGSNLLVVIVLQKKLFFLKAAASLTSILTMTQFCSSDLSSQLIVWSHLTKGRNHSPPPPAHLCSMPIHCPSLQVNSPSPQVVTFTCLICPPPSPRHLSS